MSPSGRRPPTHSNRTDDGGREDANPEDASRASRARDRRQADEASAERRRPTDHEDTHSLLDALRDNPVRNGLIGLAVVGAAAPIAVSRHQQALRTDPSHESSMAHGITGGSADPAAVAGRWRDLDSRRASATNARESVISRNVARYAEYGLTRALATSIYDVATANSIDPEVAFGLVRAESSFKNSSTSSAGAVGLTQLMPRTAAWLEPGTTRSELRDPQTNLRIGFSYLRNLIDKYNGDTDLALTAYNRGPGTVDRELNNGSDPDNGYAAFVRGEPGHGHRLFTQ